MSTNIQSNFVNLLGILEALPQKLPDDLPLRDAIPALWPTIGDLRDLCRRANIVRRP